MEVDKEILNEGRIIDAVLLALLAKKLFTPLTKWDAYTLGIIDKDYQNLFSLGYFEEIFISTEQAVDKETKMPIQGMTNLIFEFIEKSTIRKTIFRGNKHLPFAMLLDGIQIKRGDFFDVSAVHSDISVIKEKYVDKGYNYVKINYEVYQDEELKEKNQIDIIFNIEEGIETYIKEIILLSILAPNLCLLPILIEGLPHLHVCQMKD